MTLDVCNQFIRVILLTRHLFTSPMTAIKGFVELYSYELNVKGDQSSIERINVLINVFATSIRMKFPYLVNKSLKNGQEIRRVAQLEWITIDEGPFQAAGLTFTPLQVMRGEDYKGLGFLFGRKQKVAYISDVSRFPKETEYAISKNGAGQVDLLILDTLMAVITDTFAYNRV